MSSQSFPSIGRNNQTQCRFVEPCSPKDFQGSSSSSPCSPLSFSPSPPSLSDGPKQPITHVFMNECADGTTSSDVPDKATAPRPRRPLNAFMLFRADFCRQAKLNRSIENDHRHISRIVGYMWNGLSADKREVYQQKAERVKLEHHQKYPGYRFVPTARAQKPLKRNVKRNGEEDLKRCRQLAELLLLGKGGEELETAVSPLDTPPDNLPIQSTFKSTKKQRKPRRSSSKAVPPPESPALNSPASSPALHADLQAEVHGQQLASGTGYGDLTQAFRSPLLPPYPVQPDDTPMIPAQVPEHFQVASTPTPFVTSPGAHYLSMFDTQQVMQAPSPSPAGVPYQETQYTPSPLGLPLQAPYAYMPSLEQPYYSCEMDSHSPPQPQSTGYPHGAIFCPSPAADGSFFPTQSFYTSDSFYLPSSGTDPMAVFPDTYPS